MPTVADLLAVPTEIVVDGVTYPLRKPTLEEQGKFQRWLEMRAWSALDRSAEYRGEEEVARDRRALTRDITAGVYSFDGEASIAAQGTAEGIRKLFELVAGMPPDVAAKAVEERLTSIVTLWRSAQDDDPKAAREALLRLGLPASFLDASNPSGSSNSGTRRSTSRGKKSGRSRTKS